MAVIGIDLGTTYSAAARCVNGRAEVIPLEGHPTFPSVVSLLPSGKMVFGWTAKRNQERAPHSTVIEVKRKMGEQAEVSLGEKQCSPQEISAFILARIKELAEDQLGERVTGAVISCPAYFKEPAHAATKQAGEVAGLKVLRVINEPTAAAYAYGVRQGDDQKENDQKEKLFVVYDLGGGTFDVTVIKMTAGSLEVIGTGGDPQLGGGNFDDLIVDWMLAEIEKKNPGYAETLTDEKRTALRLKLKLFAEEGKIKLCEAPGPDASYQFQLMGVDAYQGLPVLFTEVLTRVMFEEMIRDLLDNSLKWIDEAMNVPRETHGYEEEHLTAILLVGGSTRIPLVREMLEKRFAKTETPIWGQERGINPDEIVALGAGIVAADLDPDANAQATGSVLVDVTGHTLAVGVWDDRRQRKVLAPIIEKETPIPCENAHRFQSQGQGQRMCRIEVYQGEGVEIDPEQVTMIGAFDIEIAPIEQPTPLHVGLRLNDNGILVAHATDELSGQSQTCTLDYADSARISPDDLAKKKAQLQRQLQEVIQQTRNPLDTQGSPGAGPVSSEPGTPGQRHAGWASEPAMGPMGGMGAGQAATMMGAPPPNPLAVVNPILRSLYDKAINSFSRVPADRQTALVELVGAIEAAAKAGDAQKANGYLPQLTKLMEDFD